MKIELKVDRVMIDYQVKEGLAWEKCF